MNGISGMGWLFSIYVDAVMKAYGLDRKEAYIFAGKRARGYVESCPIKNMKANTVLEEMDRWAKEGALEWGDKLRG